MAPRARYAGQPIIKLISSTLLKQNDEWKTRHCCIQVGSITGLVLPNIGGKAMLLLFAQNTPEAACPMNTSTCTEITPA